MNNKTKSYTIQVCGDTFTILSDEPEEHMAQVINYVDVVTKEIIQLGINRQQVALLGLLRSVSLLLQHQQQLALTADKHTQITSTIVRELNS